LSLGMALLGAGRAGIIAVFSERFTPLHPTILEPEVRSEIPLPPYRRMKACSAVAMSHDLPAGPVVRKEVHLQHRPAAAGAYLDNVKGAPLEDLGERILEPIEFVPGHGARAASRTQ
jgi:hypothetical protein